MEKEGEERETGFNLLAAPSVGRIQKLAVDLSGEIEVTCINNGDLLKQNWTSGSCECYRSLRLKVCCYCYYLSVDGVVWGCSSLRVDY